MLFFAMTKPKRKIRTVFKVIGVLVLLAVIVPAGYMYLSGNGALQSFRQVFAGDEESIVVTDQYTDSLLPGEAIRVGAVLVRNPEVGTENKQTEPNDPSTVDNTDPTGNALLTEDDDDNTDNSTGEETTEKTEPEATSEEQASVDEAADNTGQISDAEQDSADGEQNLTDSDNKQPGFFARLKALVFGSEDELIVYTE